MIEFLLRPRVEHRDRVAPRKDEDRRTRVVCRRNSADGVGEAGTRRHHGDAERTPRLRVRVGREHDGALVTHVNEPHAAPVERPEERFEVSGQSEDRSNALTFDRRRHEIGS